MHRGKFPSETTKSHFSLLSNAKIHGINGTVRCPLLMQLLQKINVIFILFSATKTSTTNTIFMIQGSNYKILVVGKDFRVDNTYRLGIKKGSSVDRAPGS